MKLLRDQFPLVYTIVETIDKNKGRALLVGGAVRDMVMGLPIKDLDIEVYGLSEEQLETILGNFGAVNTVGKSFGVLRVSGLNVDWSLPRADSAGRKPDVTIDPFMSFKTAARRRDLTMNAMAFDPLTEELIDSFQGKEDIADKKLRTPDEHFFVQDPLRFFRVMQFIGRFDMMPDDHLNAICKIMDIATVSRERIEEEFRKLLLLSRRPSLGIRWLHTIGRLSEILPELAATVGIEQNLQWHPEGDVFEHTMQTCDAAASLAQQYDNDVDRLALLYAALCHDLGKVTTTQVIKGVIKSIGHEHESARFAKTMMHRITHNSDLIAAVVSLSRYHMNPFQLVSNHAKLAAYKRLALTLHPTISMRKLAILCIADKRGRNAKSHEPLTIDVSDAAIFMEQAAQAGVLDRPIPALLHGADLIDKVPPGPHMGELLKKAYKIQIDEDITDKEVLKKRIVGKKR